MGSQTPLFGFSYLSIRFEIHSCRELATGEASGRGLNIKLTTKINLMSLELETLGRFLSWNVYFSNRSCVIVTMTHFYWFLFKTGQSHAEPLCLLFCRVRMASSQYLFTLDLDSFWARLQLDLSTSWIGKLMTVYRLLLWQCISLPNHELFSLAAFSLSRLIHLLITGRLGRSNYDWSRTRTAQTCT